MKLGSRRASQVVGCPLAISKLQPVLSHSLAGPLANNIIALGTLPPVRSVAAQLQSAAAVGHSSAVATVATVTAALESTWSGQSSRQAGSRGGDFPGSVLPAGHVPELNCRDACI